MPQINQVNVGSFWKIFFKPEEEKDLKEFLKENEYPESEEGLKELILDTISPPEKPKSISMKEFLEKNPEVKILGQMGAKMLTKKLFGK